MTGQRIKMTLVERLRADPLVEDAREAAAEIERLRPAHADYTLIVSKPDEGNRVTIRSPDFPTLEVCGDVSEVFDWVTDEIEKLRAASLPGHKVNCQLNVITTGERTVCTCGGVSGSTHSTSGNIGD